MYIHSNSPAAAGIQAVIKREGQKRLVETRLSLLKQNIDVIPSIELRHLKIFRDYSHDQGITAHQHQPNIVGVEGFAINQPCVLVPFSDTLRSSVNHTSRMVINYPRNIQDLPLGHSRTMETDFWICDNTFSWYKLTATIIYKYEQYKDHDRYEEFGRCTLLQVTSTNFDTLVADTPAVVDQIDRAITDAITRWVSQAESALAAAKRVKHILEFENDVLRHIK